MVHEIIGINYTIEYVKDENHLIPLSRVPVDWVSETEVASLYVFSVSINTNLNIPTDLKYDVNSLAHRELSHLGIDKMLNKVKENCYFTKMWELVTKYINRCVNYMFYKKPKIGEIYWHPLDKSSEPFHIVHLDHIGPFVLTERDNKYILIIVDGFS